MAVKQLLSDFKGIVRAPGMLLRSESSCYTANNVIIPAPGVIRKRPGFQRKTQDVGGPIWQLYSSRLLADTFLIHMGTKTAPATVKVSDGSTISTVSTIDGGSVSRVYLGGKMHVDTCQKNHYLTSDEGVRRLESNLASGSLRYAGMPRGHCAPTGVSAGTLLADGYARAYRVTWHRKDYDGVELGGAPTSRCVVRNITGTSGYTGATMNAIVTIYLPYELGTASTSLTTTYFYRVWASLTQNLTLAEPDDELYLVQEAFLTAGNISAGSIGFTDSTPDSYLQGQPTLHTNALNYPAGEEGLTQGVQNADDPPPISYDVAYWRDVMWYANTQHRPAIFFKLLTQPTNNDTFAIGGQTYTMKTTPGVYRDVQISSGYASVNNNLEATAQNLVEVINGDTSCTCYAYHLTNSGQTPAAILLVSRSTYGLTASCSRASITRPDLYVQQVGGNDTHTNYICFSKPLRADAVPPANYLAVGPGDNRIHRIMPLRDRLVVFTDYGIYNVTGSTFADFAVSPFDLTYTILGPECVAACDDKLYAWCREGIVEIDDGGVSVISTPIEPLLEDIYSTPGLDSIFYRSFAVAYNRQHRVQFYYPARAMQVEVVMGCAKWLVWDTRTRVWTTGSIGATVGGNLDQRNCGAVRWNDDQLALGTYAASGTDGYLMFERRAGNINDYQDTDSTNSSAAFATTVAFNYMFPDTSAAQHWQRAVLHFEGTDLSSYSVPTLALSATFASDWTSTAESRTLASGDWATAIEVPPTVRRGQRFKFTLATTQIDWLSLAGVDLVFAEGDGKARRT